MLLFTMRGWQWLIVAIATYRCALQGICKGCAGNEALLGFAADSLLPSGTHDILQTSLLIHQDAGFEIGNKCSTVRRLLTVVL